MPELEQKFEKADKATLYRTLKTFQENKLIHSIEDGSGSLRYALCQDNCECDPEDLHVHFLCTNCNQTFCLNDIPVPTINLPSSFSLESANMVVKGVCSNCKKNNFATRLHELWCIFVVITLYQHFKTVRD